MTGDPTHPTSAKGTTVSSLLPSSSSPMQMWTNGILLIQHRMWETKLQLQPLWVMRELQVTQMMRNLLKTEKSQRTMKRRRKLASETERSLSTRTESKITQHQTKYFVTLPLWNCDSWWGQWNLHDTWWLCEINHSRNEATRTGIGLVLKIWPE